MKKTDVWFLMFLVILFLPFFVFKPVYNFYQSFNIEHGMIMSFLKFAILASSGELLGLRIKTGKYFQTGFGIFPKAIVWGLIGLTIKLAFTIFTKGTIAFLIYLGFTNAPEIFVQSVSFSSIIISFSISACLNIIYAPVMMTFHRITDLHIQENRGKLSSLLKPIDFEDKFKKIDWNVQWNFVFKRTIPLFWIPAHTITFLLPEEFQVLFAALLGIALGVILGFAAKTGKN